MRSVLFPSAEKDKKDVSKKSIVSVFAVDTVMLVLPLALIAFTGPVCATDAGCAKSTVYQVGVSI